FLKMPAPVPTWSGTNWNVPTCGWPTRTLVWACAIAAGPNAAPSASKAANSPVRDIVSSRVVSLILSQDTGLSSPAKAGHAGDWHGQIEHAANRFCDRSLLRGRSGDRAVAGARRLRGRGLGAALREP